MADVHRRGLLIFGGLVLLKTIDFAARGTEPWWPWFLILWAAAGAFVFLGYRWPLPVVSILTGVAFLAGFNNQHMWLLLWLPWTFLVADRDRTWLWRWQVTIVYGFAAVAKLTPDYLSGDVLARRFALPTVVLMVLAAGGLLTEAFLAFGLWRWKWAVAVGVGFHVILVATMSADLVHVARLAVFGGLVVLMYPAFQDSAISNHTGMIRPPEPLVTVVQSTPGSPNAA